jgi:hypothetical protein
MNVIELPENVCQFCKKREATRLCDKVKGEWRWVGHPPAFVKDKRMSRLITCDAEICDKCVTNITGMDLCPKCLKEIKEGLK